MKGRKKKLVKKDVDDHSNVAKDYTTYTKNELIKELQKIKKQKKYGLVWEDHPEEVVEKCKYKFPVLEEVTDMTIKKESSNVIIDGDNYHALSVLNYTHKNKIDVIYIDPPYNLGKDFVYNDNLVDKEDSYRHSKWLSFMSKRLRLAKKLLSINGVIFISVDDHEMPQLKLICNEIFGDGNFIGTFVWRKKAGAGADSKLIFTQHEYVLFYAKNRKKLTTFFEPLTEKQKQEYKNPDNDPKGRWAPTDLTAPSSDTDESRHYEIISPSGKIWKKRWSYTKKNIKVLIQNNQVWFGVNNNSMPKRKRYLSEKLGLVPRSFIDSFLTSDGKKDFEKFFKKNNRLFEYPKPVGYVKHFVRIASNKDSIVLDFFAGSGTTGQAVLQLNKEDAGNRRFILCTNNENNICTDVCYPRIKKVINGYKNLKNERVKGLGGGLRYFRTGFVDATPTDANKKRLVDHSTGILCLKEGCFDKVTATKHYAMFTDGHKTFAIVYGDEGIIPVKNAIVKRRQKCLVYVFSLDEYDKAEEFEQVSHLVTLKPIPASILNLYRRLFK